MLGQAKESTTPQETIDQLLIRAEADVGRDPRSMARIPFFRPVSIEVDDRCYSGFCRDLSPESIGLLHCMKLPLRNVSVIIPIATNKKCKMLVRIEQLPAFWRGMVYQWWDVCRRHSRRTTRRRTARGPFGRASVASRPAVELQAGRQSPPRHRRLASTICSACFASQSSRCGMS